MLIETHGAGLITKPFPCSCGKFRGNSVTVKSFPMSSFALSLLFPSPAIWILKAEYHLQKKRKYKEVSNFYTRRNVCLLIFIFIILMNLLNITVIYRKNVYYIIILLYKYSYLVIN